VGGKTMLCKTEEMMNCRIYKANSNLMDRAMSLLEALEKYGQHKSDCHHGEIACDCGLDKVIYSHSHKLPNLRMNASI
jgi:hypothetical protein